MKELAMLVNLNRCTGCWTCSIACKMAHQLEVDEFRQYVRTIGGSELDEPGGTYPDLHMKWMPIYTQKCTLCADTTVNGEEPACSYHCPTKALTFGDMADPQSAISLRTEELKSRGFRIFDLPKWENTRSRIHYAEK